ncbi:hypothetical protein Droror1_Dr00004852 [Drosera rotundifolia]
MDAETRRRIKSTVSEILKCADVDSMTELSVRAMAAVQLGLDLSDLASKKLISTLIDSFLLELQLAEDEDNTPAGPVNAASVDGDAAMQTCSMGVVAEEEVDKRDDVVPVGGDGGGDFSRVICDLSKRRHVTVSGSKGNTIVSITEFYEKDGNRVPTQKGAILTSEQW